MPIMSKPVLRGPCRVWCIVPITSVLLSLCSAAEAGNALEKAIETAQPCRSLKVNTGLFTIGVDQFEKAELEELAVDVKGDIAVARAIGSLSCRTSDKAAVKGNVSARLSFDAELNLGTCAVSQQEIKLLSAGGTFGGVVTALGEQITQSLGDGLASEIRKLCP